VVKPRKTLLRAGGLPALTREFIIILPCRLDTLPRRDCVSDLRDLVKQGTVPATKTSSRTTPRALCISHQVRAQAPDETARRYLFVDSIVASATSSTRSDLAQLPS